jgi:AraC-like DNA-binding protein
MNPAQTEVLVYFQLLANDFSIEDVTLRLGLTPTETFKRGDKSTYSSRPREYTSWSLGTAISLHLT